MVKEFKLPNITAKDIILPPFRNEPIPRNVPFSKQTSQTNPEILAFDNYLSTPLFIKRLTQISDELITQPNQAAYLREKLREVNAQLPASVYIPFLSQSMRNYAVLHIVADESRIFRTKERAPIMLTLECYRPIELTLEKKPLFLEVDHQLQNQNVVSEEPNFLKDLNVKKKMSRSVIGNDVSSSEVFNPFESDIKEKEQLLSNQLEVPS